MNCRPVALLLRLHTLALGVLPLPVGAAWNEKPGGTTVALPPPVEPKDELAHFLDLTLAVRRWEESGRSSVRPGPLPPGCTRQARRLTGFPRRSRWGRDG